MEVSMQQAERKHVRRIEFFPELDMVLLGLLASLTVQAFRISAHELPIAVWIEALVLTALPLIVFWCVNRNFAKKGIMHAPDRSTVYRLQAGAFGMVVLCLLAQWISRSCGLGDANEIVALLMINYVAWYLIVFSKFSAFARAGFLLACTLVLFVCFTADSIAVFVCAFFFAILALWWLLGNYWSRVNSKALDGTSETLSISGTAMLISMLVVSLTGLLVWSIVPDGSVLSANGFAPFSGGTNGNQDPYAIKGVGDGDMLAAGENATTTGAVDSDQFIEDDKPSIYDMVSDTYDAPAKIKKRNNRAVALDSQAKHLHDVIQSEQSGRSFRTVRERPAGKKLKLKDRISKALFYVEGSVPARFTLDCFHEFDGWDWSKVTLKPEDFNKSPISLRNLYGKPWYVVNRVAREYLSAQRAHRVKIMRLSTNTLPASSLTGRWHIHRMDVPDMFRWNKQGIIRMDGSVIPTQTMIDVVSYVPNYHTLRSTGNLMLVDHPSRTWGWIDRIIGVVSRPDTTSDDLGVVSTHADSPLVQIPENDSRETLEALVHEVTADHRAGWNQVEAIVNHFRSNFKLDRNLVASDEGIDSVTSFLDNGGGPSYLFASTAAQTLRAAGYRTRLASGFLVQREDFDRKANQSIVTKENLHMWPEVCIDGWNWIPVEPTPGFPVPFSHQTFWQIAKSTIIGFFQSIVRNPITTFSVTFLAFLIVRFWRETLAATSWLVWRIFVTILPGRQLSATRKMLDLRFRAAGIPRPDFVTIADWFSRVDEQIDDDFFTWWQLSNFSSKATDLHRCEIRTACQQISRDLSFRKIRTFAKHYAGVNA
jgi:hypothetical protein